MTPGFDAEETAPRSVWIDASAGVAGDMLLAALVDAGASLSAVRAAVDAVVPGEVRITREEVRRAGMRATRVAVVSRPGELPNQGFVKASSPSGEPTDSRAHRAASPNSIGADSSTDTQAHRAAPPDGIGADGSTDTQAHRAAPPDGVGSTRSTDSPVRVGDAPEVGSPVGNHPHGTHPRGTHPHRTWPDIRDLLTHAELPHPVREHALAVFARLATAEARVHGTGTDEVHFHEVGAWDSVADIVGACAALHDLGVTEVTAGPIAVGSGRVATAHGELPVPAPAVAELAAGWRVFAGGCGELATPTGLALVTTLAHACTDLPPMRLETTGVGAGSRDTPERPNVVRVLLGSPEPVAAPAPADSTGSALVLEANIDDLDPRVWPSVLSSLIEAGASDAWLIPILMKKGRPAHTLCVLSPVTHAEALRDAMFRLTSTLGVRELPVRKTTLDRGWTQVTTFGADLPVKIGHRSGVVLQATPEFEPATRLATDRGVPVRTVLAAAAAAAHNAGLTPGASLAALGIELATEPPARA